MEVVGELVPDVQAEVVVEKAKLAARISKSREFGEWNCCCC